jgi:DNA-directed RNA polymerase specialized sigma24 family protein
MNIIKAVAAVALWQTRKFDTADIAAALDVPESEVCRVIHVAREEDRRRA